MSVYGTCEACNNHTINYCCWVCKEREYKKLKDTVEHVVECGKKGFATCNSMTEHPYISFEVVIRFKTLAEAQEFYRSLGELTKSVANDNSTSLSESR